MYIKIIVLHILMGVWVPTWAGNNDLNYYIFEWDGKMGIKNTKGEIVVPAQYDDIGWSDNDFNLVEDVTGYKLRDKWGLLSVNNKRITDTLYTSLSSYSMRGLIIASVRDNISGDIKFGLIKSNGKVVVDFHYNRIKLLKNGVITYSKPRNNVSNVGLLNYKGEEVIPNSYRNIHSLGSDKFIAENNEEKLHIYSSEGNRMGKYNYDSISDYQGNFAYIYKFHKVGLINRNGEILAEPEYKDVEFIREDSSLNVLPFPQWISVSISNEKHGEFSFENITPLNDSVFLVSASGKNFLINRNSEIITKGGYDKITQFVNGLSIIQSEGNFGVLNTSGELILNPLFKNIERSGDLFIVSERNGTVNIYTKSGKKISPVGLNKIETFNQSWFRVRKDDFWGMMNRSGDMVMNPVYDSIANPVNNRMVVKFQGLYGVIDMDENWVVMPQEYPLKIVNDNLYMLKKEGQRRLYSISGELIYFTENPLKFSDSYMLEYQEDGKIWKIDYSGVILPGKVEGVVSNNSLKYSEIEDIFEPSEGFTGIKKDGKYGFIDSLNRLRIANRYDSIGRFKEGLASVMILGKWGFINKREEIVLQPNYSRVGEFDNGITTAFRDDKYFIINKNGESYFKEGFDLMEKLETGNYLIKTGSKFGLIDTRGRSLIPAVFDFLIDLGNGYAIISKLGKYGVIDLNGRNIIPRIYDKIYYFPEGNIYMLKEEVEWQKIKLKNNG